MLQLLAFCLIAPFVVETPANLEHEHLMCQMLKRARVSILQCGQKFVIG